MPLISTVSALASIGKKIKRKDKNSFFINDIFRCSIIMQEAQTFAIRLSAHHKPHVNMGKLRLMGQPQYYMCCSFSVVIESLLSNMSALLSDCRCKYTK
jgi:hypothetical protein